MAVVAAELGELALLKTIMEIEHIPNLLMLSHKDNSKLKHQPRLLLQLALRTLMQLVRPQPQSTNLSS